MYDYQNKYAHQYKRRRQENERGYSNTNFTSAAFPSQKERHVRKTKWNSSWQAHAKRPAQPMQKHSSNKIASGPFEWLKSNQPTMNVPANVENIRNVHQFSSRNVPEPMWQPNPIPFNPAINPFMYVQNMKRTHSQRDMKSPVPTSGNSSGPILPLMPIVSTGNSQPNIPATVDINGIYQKLLATGIINKVKEINEQEKEKPSPVLLNDRETLKKRQPAIISALYSGTQCSSCGIRFPLEQTKKYSEHLDWHYRQNRREKDAARQVQRRNLYYSVNDWLQFEEIENVEERKKNWFETQQAEMDSASEESNQRSLSPPPSCTAGPHDNEKICNVCHDPFETFYNDETEEWHLQNAIRVEENIYHPICYDDHKVNN